jgi:ATP-dependent Clp protease ATP-binding subunit ClpC
MTQTPREYDEATERILDLARDQARRFNHPYVGAEHLVLGILSDGQSIAAQVLNELGITLDNFSDRVQAQVGRGSFPVEGDVDMAPRTQTIIDLTSEETERRGDASVTSGHLLLALIHDGGGITRRLFGDLGVDNNDLAAHIESTLASSPR